jgi:hypothetical protein
VSKKPRGTTYQGVRRQMAQLTYQQLSMILEYRYGWKLSGARVQQICRPIEVKFRQALRGF